MATVGHEQTPTGWLKRAPPATVADWILSEWSSVSTETASRSLKVTGISNCFDGATDDFLVA
ncbi:hypothetical protein HPB48_015143 [Haemaphysalis longicornis]|uniref:Uncharacterized protein n=1 Tax=Haemaphysalis longicornis TaxID=44386 RepID=A0A9J6GYA6_HAELO|nr:hypothetical protein HPB48_015143 [Haemaphysalis longicornis]